MAASSWRRLSIALRDTARKSHHAIEARADAARGPGSHRQSHPKGNQAGPERFAAQLMERCSRRVLHKAAKDKFHGHCLEHQQQDEQSQQPGENFAGQSSRSHPPEVL